MRRNLPAIGAAVRNIVLLVAILSIPLRAAEALALSPPEVSSWLLAMGASLPLFCGS
ncbi:MAG: hypothetical protein P8129_10030 [Anaerolineae bacterium]